MYQHLLFLAQFNELNKGLFGSPSVRGNAWMVGYLLKLPFFCDPVSFPSLLHYQEPDIKERIKAQKTF
ncbi:hypothetical protein L2E82_30549 [Cichorium intybus]|uniref:Uncharacterized protein n=1 Tax=Cichorium intybus TaxID=13427 RepID=A0ACB9D105_CICIN|nr:hypothetical protein L2E82_30549 [Cichorium intybus]